jgi:hypothetical protein
MGAESYSILILTDTNFGRYLLPTAIQSNCHLDRSATEDERSLNEAQLDLPRVGLHISLAYLRLSP